MPDHPKPLKKLGQNFLINKEIANHIVESLDILSEDTIIEIGPGRGVLTDIIVKKNYFKYYAFEIDKRLQDILTSKFGERCDFIWSDFVSAPLKDFVSNENCKLKIIGNIPYHLTSSIIFKILEESRYVSNSVLMVQKEVADRILAKNNNKNYGIMSVMVEAQAEIMRVADVSKNDFFPVPGVDSTVIKLTVKRERKEIENFDIFNQIVHKTFNQRRKMLSNSLKQILSIDEIGKIGSVNLNLRPENLTVDQFFALTHEIKRMKTI